MSRRRLRSAALLAATLVVGGGCGGPAPDAEVETISRETFVDTYVQLRMEALENASGEILAPQRERVLEENGVSEEDLLTFVEVHGDDVAFMRALWDEVEGQINIRRGEAER